jgi:hypothetical protein
MNRTTGCWKAVIGTRGDRLPEKEIRSLIYAVGDGRSTERKGI